MNKEILKAHGVDYDAGVRRFMGDEPLYEEMLIAFLADECAANAESALKKQDYKALFEQVHALKGVAGNLDMTELYRAASELTNVLRKEELPGSDAIAAMCETMLAAYRRVMAGIQAAS